MSFLELMKPENFDKFSKMAREEPETLDKLFRGEVRLVISSAPMERQKSLWRFQYKLDRLFNRLNNFWGKA